MKKSTLLIILLLIITSIISLSSCKIKPGNGGNNSSGAESAPEGNYLWSPATQFTIAYSSDFSYDYAMEIYTRAYELTGKFPIITNNSNEFAYHKLVIGNTDEAIAEEAYRHLDKMLDSNIDISGYVIYGMNGSVAIAYSDLYVVDLAKNKFLELFDSETSYFENGVLYSESELTVDYVNEAREEERAEAFEKLKEELPEDTVDALHRLYTAYYDESLYLWVADLYDPATGAFYYSNSARNTVGFLPDLESTRQLLDHICITGLLVDYNNSWSNAFTDEMKERMTDWIKGLQSSEDGYFYHPQWGTDIRLSRLGRDLDWATQLLKTLKSEPLYDTPNGISGSLGAPGASAISFTQRLGRTNAAIATSKVIAVAATPDHMKSEEEFREYLDSLNFTTESYGTGNELAAQVNQINAAGLSEFFVNYVNEKQNPENGLWQEELSYYSVNGLFKIGSAIRSAGGTIQYIDKAFESAMAMALTPELTEGSDNHVCSIYNMWEVMEFLIWSAEDAYGQSKVDELRARVIENSYELVTVTFNKMLAFKRDNGGFSYYPHQSAELSQGVLVAVNGTLESDVNASTILSNGTMGGIFSCLGVNMVKMYYSKDGMYFLDYLFSKEEVIKDPETQYTREEAIATFEGGFIQDGFTESYGDSNDIVDFDSPEYSGTMLHYSVVADPDNAENNVLSVQNKTASALHGRTEVKAAGKGGCYVFETKIRSGEVTKAGYFTYLQFYDTGGKKILQFTLYVYADGKIVIDDNNILSGTNQQRLADLPGNKWYDLKMEYYKSDVLEENCIKFYVNGTLVYENVAASIVTKNPVSYARLQHQRSVECTMYYDDMVLMPTNKVFVPELNVDDGMSGPADFEEGLINDGSTKSYAYEDIFYTKLNNKLSEYSGAINYSVVTDPKNAANRVLRVESLGNNSSDSGRTVVNALGEGNCYVFEMKLYAQNLGSSKQNYTTYLDFYDVAGRRDLRITLYTHGNGNVIIDDGNRLIDDKAETIVNLPVDTWHDIKIEYYKSSVQEENYVKFYVGGKCVWEDNEAYEVNENVIEFVRLQHLDKTATVNYYDDLSFTAISKEYKAEDPSNDDNTGDGNIGGNDEEPPTVPSGPADFEEGFINDGSISSSTNDLSTGADARTDVADGISEAIGPNISYSVVADPANAANKVLKVEHKANGVSDAGRTTVNASGSGNCYVFETKMYVTSTTADGVTLRFSLYDTAGKETVRIHFKAKADGTIYVYDSANIGITNLNVDTWYNLKIEYYVVSATENYVKFCVGGECIWETSSVKAATSNAISYARLQHGAYTETSSYYDDMSLIASDKEYVAKTEQ